jgi:hypothetical protein
MYRNWYGVILLLCVVFPSLAQDSTRVWDGSPLQASFLFPKQETGSAYQFDIEIVYKLRKEKIKPTTYSYFACFPQLKAYNSWVSSGESAEKQLRFGTVLFDYAEYFSRLMQQDIHSSNNLPATKDKFNKQMNDAFGALALDTKYGTDTIRIQFWEGYTDSLLQHTPRITFPETFLDKFSMAYGFGGGYIAYNGDLDTYFREPVLFVNTFHFSYKRFNYGFQFAYGNTQKVRNEFYHAKWQFGDTTRLQQIHTQFSLGYDVVKRERISLTPFVGFSSFRLIQKYPTIPEGEPQSPSKLVLFVGGMIDWGSKPFFKSSHSSFSYGVNTRFLYAPVNYIPAIRGSIFQVSCSLMIFIQSTTTRKLYKAPNRKAL